jgi:hypothetical protein
MQARESASFSTRKARVNQNLVKTFPYFATAQYNMNKVSMFILYTKEALFRHPRKLNTANVYFRADGG